MNIREFLRANIAAIDEVYLDHEAGLSGNTFVCHCGFSGTEENWLEHLADKIADALTETTVELPS